MYVCAVCCRGDNREMRGAIRRTHVYISHICMMHAKMYVILLHRETQNRRSHAIYMVYVGECMDVCACMRVM